MYENNTHQTNTTQTIIKKPRLEGIRIHYGQAIDKRHQLYRFGRYSLKLALYVAGNTAIIFANGIDEMVQAVDHK